MKPANRARRLGGGTRLLALAPDGQIHHTTVQRLGEFLSAGDLLVVNRSATLPSSFSGHLERTGEPVEIRLAAFQGPSSNLLTRWTAVSFGQGGWRTPTEKRGSPPRLAVGDVVTFGSDLSLQVTGLTRERLMNVEFQSSDLERNLYLHGRPIQYSYHTKALAIWDQQTIFSGPPVSVEPPSAAFPMTWELILGLRELGVRVADIVHGAGISSTGSPDLDSHLPLREWYEIPDHTAEEHRQAKIRGGKIVAVGTTVLRALESAWDGQRLRPGSGTTDLKITAEHRIESVGALITGMHEVGSSHMQIIHSLCPVDKLRQAYGEAEAREYLGHEFGDIALVSG